MITTRTVSTIWHGPVEWLKVKLDDLVARRELDFYAIIPHHKEEDEKKGHCHVFCIPSKRLDTDSLRDFLSMPDLSTLKPIVPLPFTFSKFGDWYLYSLHDATYLASKGQKRKYHYKREDFITSDDDYFAELIHQINLSQFKTQDRVKALIEQGITWDELVSRGIIPVTQLAQYKIFYDSVVRFVTKNYEPVVRGKGKTHEVIDDDDLPF